MAPSLKSLRNRIRAAGDVRAVRKSLRHPADSVTGYRPLPKPSGNAVLGEAATEGTFLFGGREFSTGDGSIWDLKLRSPAHFNLLHGFGWLDDLAADGSRRARIRAATSTLQWIERFGNGQPVEYWAPATTGQRITRWLNHFDFLTAAMNPRETASFETSLTHQTWFLNKRARSSPAGVPSLEALTGLILGIAAFELRPGLMDRASRWLSTWAARNIDPDGGIATRNPQQLARVLVLLSSATDAIRARDQEPDQSCLDAMHLVANAVRRLRLGNGALARFHGGDAGAVAQIDHAIAGFPHAPEFSKTSPMGFTRLTNGGSVMVVDTAQWPLRADPQTAFCSTLAFEFTSGRIPLLINAGPSILEDADSADFARSPAGHNTLWIAEGLYPLDAPPIRPDPPQSVIAETEVDHRGTELWCQHDGYAKEIGFIHERTIELTDHGYALRGDDRLLPAGQDSSGKYGTSNAEQNGGNGYTVLIGFCVHPDVKVRVDSDDSVVHLVLPNEETWRFGMSGGTLALLPATVMDPDRLELVSTSRIVVSARVSPDGSRVLWWFVCTEKGRHPI